MAQRFRFHESVLDLLEPIENVQQHPRNVNMGDVDAIVNSIQRYGFTAPVLAQKSTGYIVAGNHRYAAVHELGGTQIPVIWLDLDDDQALRYMLDDNRSTRLGKDDLGLLYEVLSDIKASNPHAVLEQVTLFDEVYYETLGEMVNDPFSSDDTEEYAKQRSGHVCECPRCGWKSGEPS